MAGPYPLATLAPTISAAGISSTPTYADILASLTASAEKIFGSDVYLQSDSQDGELLAVFALAQHNTNDTVRAAYANYSPASAVGAALSSIVKINRIRRQGASNSTAVLDLIGVAGTSIVAGIVRDENGNQWALPPLVTIPFSGEIFATATCLVPGAVTAAANTIKTIQNPVRGWQTATNSQPATPGAPVELDAQLRQRQSISTSLSAQTTREAIEAGIANIAGVVRVKVFQNDGDAQDANGIPGHTIAPVVAGGDVAAVAALIAAQKSPGCGTFGTTQVVVFDSAGVPDTINFFELATVQIYVGIAIEALPGYVGTTGNLITSALVAAINGLDIGQSVYISRLWGPAALSGDAATSSSGLTQTALDALSATYIVRTLAVGVTAASLTNLDVSIPFYSAAATAAGNISLTVATSFVFTAYDALGQIENG